ncbi:hypothetical protein [Leeia sp.]|uniref:hypothetical protein n=1 Tax=Leeia sp. TaxID=2884678 RepID=UPI0035AEAF8B
MGVKAKVAGWWQRVGRVVSNETDALKVFHKHAPSVLVIQLTTTISLWLLSDFHILYFISLMIGCIANFLMAFEIYNAISKTNISEMTLTLINWIGRGAILFLALWLSRYFTSAVINFEWENDYIVSVIGFAVTAPYILLFASFSLWFTSFIIVSSNKKKIDLLQSETDITANRIDQKVKSKLPKYRLTFYIAFAVSLLYIYATPLINPSKTAEITISLIKSNLYRFAASEWQRCALEISMDEENPIKAIKANGDEYIEVRRVNGVVTFTPRKCISKAMVSVQQPASAP